MEHNASFLVRDILYIGACLIGAFCALSLMTVIRRRRLGRQAISRRWILAAVLFSCALVCFTLSFIYSRTMVVRDTHLLYVALVFLICSFFAVVFPLFAGFPLLVALLSAMILFSWSFLVYPEAQEDILLGRIRVSSKGNLLFWLSSNVNPDIDSTIPDFKNLALRVMEVEFDRRIPFVGGSFRLAAREIVADNRSIRVSIKRSLIELLGFSNPGRLVTVPGVTWRNTLYPLADPFLDDGARRDIVWRNKGPVLVY